MGDIVKIDTKRVEDLARQMLPDLAARGYSSRGVIDSAEIEITRSADRRAGRLAQLRIRTGVADCRCDGAHGAYVWVATD